MSVDVNEAFAAERASQAEAAQAATAAWDQRVADGKLVPIGGGQFRVNDPGSWDNGEIFTQRNGIAVPQSGLDLNTDGTANLYTAVPAWHGLGNVIPGGTTDVEQVLDLSGLNFDVEQRTARYSFQGKLLTVPDTHINVRSDTGAALGVVGKVYTVVQNRDGFAFLADLVASGETIWESAGPLDGGKKVFISMRLPDTIVVDAGGINDEIIPFVAVINSHTGNSPFIAIVTPWRPVCRNTERLAVSGAYTKWTVRHTKTALDRIAEAQRTLGLSRKFYEQFAAEENQLARIDMQLAEFEALAADLWPVKDEPSQREATIAATRADALRERWAVETGRVGLTAYAAERVITGYLDEDAPKRNRGEVNMAAARATAILDDGGTDKVKSAAHQKLMLKTR